MNRLPAPPVSAADRILIDEYRRTDKVKFPPQGLMTEVEEKPEPRPQPIQRRFVEREADYRRLVAEGKSLTQIASLFDIHVAGAKNALRRLKLTAKS